MTTVAFKIKGADAQPIPNAIYDITLTESGIDFLGDSLVLPTSVNGSADANGEFEVELAPISTAPYVIVILDSSGRRKSVFEMFVPDSESTVNADDLVVYPKPTNVNYDAVAIAAIIDSRVRAEQAAESVENFNVPRYQVSNLAFANDGGIQTATLSSSNNNGFLQVTESDGRVIVPLETTTSFPIGSAIVFVNATDPTEVIDIDFVPESAAVTVDSLGLSTIKLENSSDMVALVKTATNSWKLLNAAGGAGGSYDSTILALTQTIADIEDNISTLEGWRTAYDTQLNAQSTSISSHTLALASVNNSLAGLNAALAAINSTIDAKINAAIPGLGDLTSYVTDAETAQAAAEVALAGAEAALVAAGVVAANANISANTAEAHKDDAETAQTAAELAQSLAEAAGVTNTADIAAINALIKPYQFGAARIEGKSLGGSAYEDASSLHWKEDGTQLFWIDYVGNDLKSVTFATPWDLSTIDTSVVTVALDAGGPSTKRVLEPVSVWIDPTGDHMFITDIDDGNVVYTPLSTSWDISTRGTGVRLDVSSDTANPRGLMISPDGVWLSVIHANYSDKTEQQVIYQYEMSTAFDVTTATKITTKVVNDDDAVLYQELKWNDDGTTFYTLVWNLVTSNHGIKAYPGNTIPYKVSTSSAGIAIPFNPVVATWGTCFGFSFGNDGTELYLGLNQTSDASEDLYVDGIVHFNITALTNLN